mgnify:CR=1 FL=1
MDIFPIDGLVSPNFQSLSLPEKVIDYLWHITMPVTCMVVTSLATLTFLTLMNLDHPSFEFLEFLFFALGFTTSSQVISYPAIFESNDSSVTGICESFSATLIMSGYAVFPIIYGFLLDFNDHVTYVAQDHKLAFYILPLSLIISFILNITI